MRLKKHHGSRNYRKLLKDISTVSLIIHPSWTHHGPVHPPFPHGGTWGLQLRPSSRYSGRTRRSRPTNVLQFFTELHNGYLSQPPQKNPKKNGGIQSKHVILLLTPGKIHSIEHWPLWPMIINRICWIHSWWYNSKSYSSQEQDHMLLKV